MAPNNSLKPTRRARGYVVALRPPVWAMLVSTRLLRRVGVRLAVVAGWG